MNEKMNKALVYFGREDLTDGLYENDIDDNVQVFLTIRQMIKLYNLQAKIDKAIELIEKEDLIAYFRETNNLTLANEFEDLYKDLKEDK